jgi:hypothetical protein
VRVLFRVCEIPDHTDLLYFIHRDVGEGQTLIEAHERPGYLQDSRFSLQLFLESKDLNSQISLTDQLPLTGRPMANQIRFDLVRYWISCLKVAKKPDTTPLSIKLIDTVDGKLIEADTSFRYVALSYVWGGYKQAELKKDTRAMFYSSGSITESSPCLSWTIKDTITVCRALNERYLWIDCLCIQQDDSVHKTAQIERMDVIYGHAVFTIVNAGHQDRLNANSPLSGVRSNTRTVHQFIARADSFSILANRCPCLQEDLDLSKWRSRAWTFQEEHLSRALLIFTGSQCFLQAGRRLFCEDMVFETDQAGTALIPLTYSSTQSYHCKADADAAGEYDLEDYCFIIESYVKRDLTFDEDAIRAVLGMIRRFSVKLDGRESRLIFGHPSAAFDYSLCWTSTRFFPNTRRSGFPSWSWASWKQHVEFDLGHQHDRRKNLTFRGRLATSLYTDALSDGRFTVNKLLVQQIGIDVLPVRKPDSDIQSYYHSHGLSAAILAERELHFSTTCLKLRVSRYCVIAGEKLDAGRAEHASSWGPFIVYTDRYDPADASSTTPKEIGEIRLESTWRDTQPVELYLDFIVIRTNPAVEPFCGLKYSNNDKTTNTALNLEDLDPFFDFQSTGNKHINAVSTAMGQQQTLSNLEPPKPFPAQQDCTIYTSKAAERMVPAAENWRLSLMCIEWIDVPSGVVGQGGRKQKEAIRRVARRLDIMRYGPSIREWLDLDPIRADIILV